MIIKNKSSQKLGIGIGALLSDAQKQPTKHTTFFFCGLNKALMSNACVFIVQAENKHPG